jgi:hypothetical protein
LIDRSLLHHLNSEHVAESLCQFDHHWFSLDTSIERVVNVVLDVLCVEEVVVAQLKQFCGVVLM